MQEWRELRADVIKTIRFVNIALFITIPAPTSDSRINKEAAKPHRRAQRQRVREFAIAHQVTLW
jgi:hypothetical protein